MGKHILWSALMVLLLFKLAIPQTGTPILWFTDKLPSLNWFIPKGATIFEDTPDDLKLPSFKGASQIYGKIQLGNSENPYFYFAVDLLAEEEERSGAHFYEAAFYIDKNQNMNLTDDGLPVRLGRRHQGKVRLSVTYENGSKKPYAFEVYVYFAEWDKSYHVVYYRACAWMGYVKIGVKIGEEGQTAAILLIDDNTDGLYNSPQDIICVDLNGDWIPDPSCGSNELISLSDAFYLGGTPYIVDYVAPDGTYISFRIAPEGEILGVVESASTGEPLPGVKIEAWASAHRETFTQEDGHYMLKLAEGCWNLRASLPGFIPVLEEGVCISGKASLRWDITLQRVPLVRDTVTLYDGDSYDFATGERGKYTGGDLYFSNGEFWANNLHQRGLLDLGGSGLPLDDIVPPQVGYTRFGVKAVIGHTYVALLHEGIEGCFMIFRVIDLTANSVTIEYLLRCADEAPDR